VRKDDDKAIAAMLGEWWRVFVPNRERDFGRDRTLFLAAWDDSHKVNVDGDKAIVEVGKTGWTLPIPIVKDGSEWRFDSEAGIDELGAREIGRDELGAIQTLLAIVDAQRDYAAMDPMKTASPVYARRLKSLPGKKDGLYWPAKPGEPESPLGELVANAQDDGIAPGGHYGYNFRLLYAQGPAAPGGALNYLVNGHMLSFAAIAWPGHYGETGIMTFMVNHDGVLYQRDLGPETRLLAPAIASFNPEKGWEKADVTP
ncbi:MAG TPA: DUF2950 domain-containing protein, partial [Reyranella sp.]